MRFTESDHPNPGLVESCEGCRWKLKETIIAEGKSSACAQVILFEGVILQVPQLWNKEECWDYGIPSPYDEQLSVLVRGKTPEEMSILPKGLPPSLSEELLFYAAKAARFYQL